MRKQGDNAASIPKRPASSPGSRLGACMKNEAARIIPRLAPGGLDGGWRSAVPTYRAVIGLNSRSVSPV